MIQAFLNYIKYEKNYSDHTVLSYGKDLTEYSDYLLSVQKSIGGSDVSFQDVRMWMLQLSESGNKASTINRKLSALKSFYKYHNAAGTLNYNPTTKIIAPQKNKALPIFFKEKDLEVLLQDKKKYITFEDIRDALVIDMLYQTGMRCSELVGIKNSQLDIEKNTIKVLGKGNKERLIPFGQKLKESIQDYVSIKAKEIEIQTDSFFVLKNGSAISQYKVYTIVKRNMSMVTTMQKRSPHVLRHTFATTMLNNGADINAIKSILGHESLEATQVYMHTTFDKLHNIYEQAHPRAIKKRRNYEP